MKTAALALCALLTLSSVACMKNASVTPPSSAAAGPNTAVLVALESASAACTITAPLVNGPVSTWLAGPCAAAMSSIVGIVEANGTAAEIQATINTLEVTIKALPPGTADLQYANAALALANEVLTIYEQVTGQTVTSSMRIAGAFAFADRPKALKIHWSKADKARLAVIKAKLASKGGR